MQKQPLLLLPAPSFQIVLATSCFFLALIWPNQVKLVTVMCGLFCYSLPVASIRWCFFP